MGFSHYYNHTQNLDQETWNEFIKDCKTLYKNMPDHSKSSGAYHADDPLILTGDALYKSPKFTKDLVYFNGGDTGVRVKKGKYWEEAYPDGTTEEFPKLSHETFVLKRQGDGGFCKTARKPYDLMVQACLILLLAHFPKDAKVSSDGDSDDWYEATEFVKTHIKSKKLASLLMGNKLNFR